MPLKYPDYQREFKFQINGEGLPVANVITLGNGRWLTVCPLCSCAHDVTTHKGDVYEPKCILKVTHPHVYAAWLKVHPEAAQHTRVELVCKPLEIRPYVAPEKPKKARKSAASAPKMPENVRASEPDLLRFAKVTGARARKPAKSTTPPGTKNLRKPEISARVNKGQCAVPEAEDLRKLKISARVEKPKRRQRSQPPKVAAKRGQKIASVPAP